MPGCADGAFESSSSANADEADKYRALCFLGLNRAQDAGTRSIARHAGLCARPIRLAEAVATFRDVRAGPAVSGENDAA